jgi:hypothetical protein
MSKYKEYWSNLDPIKKEAQQARHRSYTNARYHRMKANGLIKLKGRRVSKHGPEGKRGFVRDYIDARKVEIGECFDCGLPCEQWSVIMFAFDHLIPAEKSFALSKAVSSTPLTLIDNEIAKCQLVCHCCHAIRTVTERHYLGLPKANTLPLLEMMYAAD